MAENLLLLSCSNRFFPFELSKPCVHYTTKPGVHKRQQELMLADQDIEGGSREVDAEKAGVWTVWTNVEQLLTGDRESAETFVRTLMTALPNPAEFTSPELHVLAQLHLGSAQNVTKTVRIAAPIAFKDDAVYPELSVLDSLEGMAMSMVSVLIELQLFHLQRAAMLTAHLRGRLALRQRDATAV